MSKKEIELQNKLRKKILEAGLSAHALEKKAGLKRSAVQNILYGRSKKPGAEILHAITTVLGCSISDLLGQDRADLEQNRSTESAAENHELDMALYTKAVQCANELLQTYQIKANKQETLTYINEIYQYSTQSKLRTIDKQFATWLIRKTWPDANREVENKKE